MSEIRIFDIQRCSFVDGPGIRTTVFFKGCNLRCKWCHNPEAWTGESQLAYFASRCTQCGVCAQVCPCNAIQADFFPDAAKCTACGQCAAYCPASARKVFGQTRTVDEVLEFALRDRQFYENSGGGVTCSGGECMLQVEGLHELLMKLKAQGIHTAVDTAGDVPWSSFERLLPVTDLWLFDIKCLDRRLHKHLTGVDNGRILANYERLLDAGAAVIVRVPVVTGANDVANEMERVADYIAQHRPKQVEFLPYHRMGEGKAAAIGQEAYRGMIPDASRIDQLCKRAQHAED